MSPEKAQQQEPIKGKIDKTPPSSPETPSEAVERKAAETARTEGRKGESERQDSLRIGRTKNEEEIYLDGRFRNLGPESLQLLITRPSLSELLQICLGIEKGHAVLVQPTPDELREIMSDRNVLEQILKAIVGQNEPPSELLAMFGLKPGTKE